MRNNNTEKTLSRNVQGAMENTPENNAALRGERFTTSIGNALARIVEKGPLSGIDQIERAKDVLFRSIRQAIFPGDPEDTVPPFEKELGEREMLHISMAMEEILSLEMVPAFLEKYDALDQSSRLVKDLNIKCPPHEKILSQKERRQLINHRKRLILPANLADKVQNKLDPKAIETEITLEKLLEHLSKNLSEELKNLPSDTNGATFWSDLRSHVSYLLCDHDIFDTPEEVDPYWLKETSLPLSVILEIDERIERLAQQIKRKEAKKTAEAVRVVIMGDPKEIFSKATGKKAQ